MSHHITSSHNTTSHQVIIFKHIKHTSHQVITFIHVTHTISHQVITPHHIKLSHHITSSYQLQTYKTRHITSSYHLQTCKTHHITPSYHQHAVNTQPIVTHNVLAHPISFILSNIDSLLFVTETSPHLSNDLTGLPYWSIGTVNFHLLPYLQYTTFHGSPQHKQRLCEHKVCKDQTRNLTLFQIHFITIVLAAQTFAGQFYFSLLHPFPIVYCLYQ